MWRFDPLQWLADQLAALPARWREWREHPAAPAVALHVLVGLCCATLGWAIARWWTA